MNIHLQDTPVVLSTDVVEPRYWAGRCQGFRVVGPEGWIGTVRHVHSGAGDACMLIVRTGLFRIRHLIVAASEIDRIEPWRQVVVLRSDPRSHLHA